MFLHILIELFVFYNFYLESLVLRGQTKGQQRSINQISRWGSKNENIVEHRKPYNFSSMPCSCQIQIKDQTRSVCFKDWAHLARLFMKTSAMFLYIHIELVGLYNFYSEGLVLRGLTKGQQWSINQSSRWEPKIEDIVKHGKPYKFSSMPCSCKIQKKGQTRSFF